MSTNIPARTRAGAWPRRTLASGSQKMVVLGRGSVLSLRSQSRSPRPRSRRHWRRGMDLSSIPSTASPCRSAQGLGWALFRTSAARAARLTPGSRGLNMTVIKDRCRRGHDGSSWRLGFAALNRHDNKCCRIRRCSSPRPCLRSTLSRPALAVTPSATRSAVGPCTMVRRHSLPKP